jgi:hypothetical protein
VLEHHERYDGAGYPRGVGGEEISLAARVIAVSDAFEVMTAPRAYRRPVDAQTARAELARHAGSQFDPVVVRHFLAIGLPELRRAMGPLAWLAEIPFVSSWPRLEAAASTTAAHAATATAAAGAAGFLAIGSSGAGVSAGTTAPVSGDSVISAAAPAGTPAMPNSRPVAAVHHQSTQTHLRGDRRVAGQTHEDARVAARSVASTESWTGRSGRTHPKPTASTTSPEPTNGDEPNAPHGHAYGHEHAPGWQKNWGPAGRHPGHRH